MKTKKNKLFLSLFFVLSFLFFVQPVLAESIPESVPFNGVYDPHNYLSSEAVSNISVFNWEYTKKTSNKENPRLAVVIIEELDNGILLFISVKDGLVRTKTARENSLGLSGKTISNLESVLKNNFEKGNYSQGIYSYVESLKENLKKPEKYEHDALEFGSKARSMTPEEKKEQKMSWSIRDGAREGVLIGAAILISIPFIIMLYSFIKFLIKGIFRFFVGNVGDAFESRKK